MTGITSEARVATEMPARYMTQLCKHFEHRLSVTYDATHGRIAFSGGTCALEAQPDTLVMRLTAEDEAARERLEDVVARHLLRFAFRRPPEIRWQRTG